MYRSDEITNVLEYHDERIQRCHRLSHITVRHAYQDLCAHLTSHSEVPSPLYLGKTQRVKITIHDLRDVLSQARGMSTLLHSHPGLK